MVGREKDDRGSMFDAFGCPDPAPALTCAGGTTDWRVSVICPGAWSKFRRGVTKWVQLSGGGGGKWRELSDVAYGVICCIKYMTCARFWSKNCPASKLEFCV